MALAARYVTVDGKASVSSSLQEEHRKLSKNVITLSRALRMGFTVDAIAELERIRRMGDAPSEPIARAAETLARWYSTNGEYQVALDRLIHARILNGHSHPERLRVLEHHLLTQLGYFDEARRLFDAHGAVSPDLHLVQANLLLHEAAAGKLLRQEADKERLTLIDWVLRKNGLVPVSDILSGNVLDYDSLDGNTAAPSDIEAGQPVVSIVVPAYNAEQTLALSVNSLRKQSFPHLQILIVDDASTDDTYAVANSLASEDPRIVVIQHSQNRGAYSARNTGLSNATGRYFTVHDADDWSHPQLIERQLKPLESGDFVASFSRLARVTRDMEFLLRPYRPMLEPIHWNYTSLLAEVALVRDLGGWDAVRAHADSELIERMREYYGTDALVEVDNDAPLSFFLVTGNNITESSDTSLRSVDFGSRKEYSEQARFWRARTFVDGQFPTYKEHKRTDAKAPFFCPRSLTANRDGVSQTYDLIIGSDLSLTGGTRRCNLAYIDCARKLGLRIGIFNMPRYRLRGSGTIDSTYRELLQLHDVDLLMPEDQVECNALLVHHPPVLQTKFIGYPSIKAARHYILVNQLPWEMQDYSSVQYDVGTVDRHYKEAFDSEPVWIPISPKVRRHLLGEMTKDRLHNEDWYPVVNWNGMGRQRNLREGSALPVVGRHSRDHATKWPESASVLEKCYLAGTEYEVRLLGGTRVAEQILGYRPRNWVVYPFDSIAAKEFVGDLDIFVHYHHSMYIEEFGRNIAEAMAEGVPCVLPPDYAEVFCEAAVYAEPYQVKEVVQELWMNRSRYLEYSARGVAFVAEYSGFDAGMRRISSLME